MWEINIVKRIFPALALLFIGIVVYMISKYVMSGMITAFNTTGIDLSTIGFGYWLLLLLPVCVAIHYFLKAWLTITGRRSSEGPPTGTRRNTSRRDNMKLPPTTPITPSAFT